MKIDNYKAIHPKAPTAADVDANIRDASKMYEKHFLTEMVKAMRTTVTPTDQPSMGEKIYAEQLDQQYVDKWSEKGGIGLSDIIYGQIKERFYPDKAAGMKPIGPLPIDKGAIKIKVDETKPMGIPILKPGGDSKADDLTYRYHLPFSGGSTGPDGQGAGLASNDELRTVTSPWKGEIQQMLQQDDRQVLKIAHDDGLVSTINFLGTSLAFQKGDVVEAGQKLGKLSADSTGMTWQLGQA